MSQSSKHIPSKKIKKATTLILDFLKKSEAVKAMFSRYAIPLSRIDYAPIKFADIPVSAKTKDEVIYLNQKFLEDGQLIEEMHYVVHELCHWLQQRCDDPHDLIPSHDVDYLDIPAELEAFVFQVRFMQECYGKKFAEDYVEGLLDFHEIDGEERKKKREALLLDT